jgi:hypothetical protein
MYLPFCFASCITESRESNRKTAPVYRDNIFTASSKQSYRILNSEATVQTTRMSTETTIDSAQARRLTSQKGTRKYHRTFKDQPCNTTPPNKLLHISTRLTRNADLPEN